MTHQRHAAPVHGTKGFTLIELLMVVLIISILMAILMPVIIHVMRTMTVVKSQQRVTSLANGAVAFFKDNGVYPGQSDLPATWGTGLNLGFNDLKTKLNAGTLTGSQVLARALFSDVDGSGFPRGNYAQYQAGETLPVPGIAGKDYTIGDCWPKGQTMALCYYPARIGETGVAMFHEADNTAYTTGNITSGKTFATAITHPAMAGTPVKANQFIIIGPGLDRTYFGPDDVSNFSAQ